MPARLDPASRPRRVGLARRVAVATGLILGLRRHDFRAARTMMKMKYGPGYGGLDYPRFGLWVLRQMFIDLPQAMATARFSPNLDRTPYWLTLPNPLTNHPWAATPDAALPKATDTLVIGAGMTGGALAYHWSKSAPADRQLVVLEMNDPSTGASGRNGGSLVMGRYFAMVKKLLEDYWAETSQHGDAAARSRLAVRFAGAYCASAYRNAEMIAETVANEGIDCDYRRNGWIQLRDESQQEALTESVDLANHYGFTDWARITPAEIERLSRVLSPTDAGFSRKAGQYHPAKWVWSLLDRALKATNVQLFTRTKVTGIEDCGDSYLVRTTRGDISARHVVLATEAYTANLARQFSGKLQPVQTQLCALDARPKGLSSFITVSSSSWFGERRDGKVVLGSDETTLPDRLAGQNKPSRWITKFVLGEVQRFTGRFDMVVQNEWSGSVGFTVDQFPVVGSLDGKRQYIIGGMCGSGTGVSFNASRCIVNRILGRSDEQDDYPPEFFAPSRLLDPARHPWPAN